MTMTTKGDQRFELRSTDPNRGDTAILVHAQSPEQYREWVDNINNILQSQHDFLKAIQSPIAYQLQQQELSKES